MVSKNVESIINAIFSSITERFKPQNLKAGCNNILKEKMQRCGGDTKAYNAKLLNNVIYLYEMSKTCPAILENWITEKHVPKVKIYEVQLSVAERITNDELQTLIPTYAKIYADKYNTLNELKEALEFDYIFYYILYNMEQMFVGSIAESGEQFKEMDLFMKENPAEIKETVLKYGRTYTNILIGNVSFK